MYTYEVRRSAVIPAPAADIFPPDFERWLKSLTEAVAARRS
ncbi:hypothetical protein QFZ70_002730 [Arthrobacter sp. V1I9]|jgi:hypothetical protein|nr:hypothetical protein [Arthrobacter sp. V1I9]MDQ0870257.1 hypothetical protein [Arthrobacter sp. V1I9]